MMEPEPAKQMNKTIEKPQSNKWKLTDYNEPFEKLLTQQTDPKVLRVSESQNVSMIKQTTLRSGKFYSQS